MHSGKTFLRCAPKGGTKAIRSLRAHGGQTGRESDRCFGYPSEIKRVVSIDMNPARAATR